MGIAEDIKNLSEDIVASYDARLHDYKKMSGEQAEKLAAFAGDLTKNAGNMVKTFQKEHKTMADGLKESLKKGESTRLKTFKDLMGDIKKGVNDIETYAKNKLKEFDDAHAEMSKNLRKELAKYVAGNVSETKNLLGGFADERQKMASSWYAMATTMAKKRGVKPVKVGAGVEVNTVEEAVEKPRKRGRPKKGGKK